MMSHSARRKLLSLIGAVVLFAAGATGTPAQELPEFEIDGLLRTGLRLESSRYDGVSGFEIYDARLGLSGKVGILFDYALRAEYQFEADAVRLLDVRLSVPLRDEVLRLDVGLLMSGFGREAMKPKDQIPFVERSQGSLALAPGRQVDCIVTHVDGTKETLKLNHTYNEAQVEWFKAGSALNLLA